MGSSDGPMLADEKGSGTIQRQFSHGALHSERSIQTGALSRLNSSGLKGDLQKPLLRAKSRAFIKPPSSVIPTLFTLVVVLGTLSLGIALGYTSPTQADIIHDLHLSLSQYSFFGSLVNLGCMVGAVSSGRIADSLGRKGALVAAAIPNLVGWIMVAMAKDLQFLYIGRFLKGLGGGIVSFTVPTYIAEVSPKHMRGTLGAMHQLAVTVGIMMAYMGGLFFQWRMLALIATIPGALLLIGLCFIIETPRWLGNADRNKDLATALQRLRGKDYNISSELSEIQNAAEVSRLQPSVLVTELFQWRLFRPLLAGIGVMALQQFSGINGIMLYAGEIFSTVGFKSPNAASLLLAMLQVAVTLTSAGLMEKAGRRLLLLLSSGGMALSAFLVGFSFFLRNIKNPSPEMDTFINVLALCSLLFYVVSFSFGLGAIPWVIMSEIFPSRVKGLAGSLATLVNWSCAWAVTLTFNFLLNWTSYGCFWLYASICLATVIFVALFVPETRGRTLEQIEASFK
ncbi:sugar transporter ERD6-like 4 [Selaginella moellendorffii]|uniref:sugar transporter ERD6-like 4 n=1 Tax=Selaginella moellendorffii TaxID=88036 RepID=UPI000D1CA0ED|nr:sugar transporter ERD6-like 4 [Selaginella moellendorffii]XP_024534161.1 sugar transporter ERD6-like 4 [Selaginella moellendorffii]|eukprot:XP_024534160.1 sugar transporter ERD6-like 4 [Selaginella moellendorffii]